MSDAFIYKASLACDLKTQFGTNLCCNAHIINLKPGIMSSL